MRQPDMAWRRNAELEPSTFSWSHDCLPALAVFTVILTLIWLL